MRDTSLLLMGDFLRMEEIVGKVSFLSKKLSNDNLFLYKGRILRVQMSGELTKYTRSGKSLLRLAKKGAESSDTLNGNRRFGDSEEIQPIIPLLIENFIKVENPI